MKKNKTTTFSNVSFMTAGAMAIGASINLLSLNEYLYSLLFLAVGILCIFLREHYKQ